MGKNWLQKIDKMLSRPEEVEEKWIRVSPGEIKQYLRERGIGQENVQVIETPAEPEKEEVVVEEKAEEPVLEVQIVPATETQPAMAKVQRVHRRDIARGARTRGSAN